MVTTKLALFSTAMGLVTGVPLSRTLMANNQSIYDINATNVYYDLAVMYGDSNKDGHVTELEYKNFDIKSVAPKGVVGEDTTFRFLGMYPHEEGKFLFYTYTDKRIDTSTINSNGKWDYKSDYTYFLDIRSSCTVDTTSESGFYRDSTYVVNASFVNFYEDDEGGVYSKFLVSFDYDQNEDGFSRLKADSFIVFDSGTTILSGDCGAGGELIFSKDDFVYYEQNAYAIESTMDLLLATQAQASSVNQYYLGWIPTGTGTDITQAKEVFYVFFNFTDTDFKPEQLLSVTCKGNIRTYKSTYYSVDYSSTTSASHNGSRDIYMGKYGDNDTCIVVPDGYISYSNTFAGDCLISTKESLSVDSYYKTIESGSAVITQVDSSDVLWKHSDITRSYSIPNLLTSASFDSVFSDDAFDTFRDWYHEEGKGRDSYSYAYAIYDDSWTRTRDNVELYASVGNSYEAYAYRTVETTCHEITSNLTIGMEVLEKGKRMSITTFDDPSTVRYVSAIGLPAPTLLEFISHDISEWFAENTWLWAVLAIVGVILLVALIFLFPPVIRALAWLFKFVVVVLYSPIWLIRAIICLAEHRKTPPLWFWGVRRYVVTYNPSNRYRRKRR